MIVNKNYYFIFIIFLLLFLLNFNILYQYNKIYAIDDGFFSVAPEDYFDLEDKSNKETSLSSSSEQLEENNQQYDQQSVSSKENKNEKLPNPLSKKENDVNFIAAGDWNCNKETEKTIKKMTKLEPELILGLGDYTFENVSPQC